MPGGTLRADVRKHGGRVGADPRVEGDRIQLVGFSGCNRYEAPVSESREGRELAIEILTQTERACEGEAQAFESRFIAALEHVQGFDFEFGRIALWWEHEEHSGRMRFVAQPPEPRAR